MNAQNRFDDEVYSFSDLVLCFYVSTILDKNL